MQVSSVAQMRALDRVHIEQDGIPEVLLMENAGLAAVQVLAQRYPVTGRRWVVLCGVQSWRVLQSTSPYVQRPPTSGLQPGGGCLTRFLWLPKGGGGRWT